MLSKSRYQYRRIVNFECDFKFVGAKLPLQLSREPRVVFGQNRAAMTGKVLPSGWLRVVRVEIYFVTINGSDEEGDGGKGRDIKRETFRFSRICFLSCRIVRMFWERSDGYWICAELDMRVTNVIVFSPQPPTGGVSQARQRRTNMASIRGAVNTSRAALYSLLLCHTRSGCVTSWRHN